MRNLTIIAFVTLLTIIIISPVIAQQNYNEGVPTDRKNTLYDIVPRWLVDVPTAGTLQRGYYDLGLQIFRDGGGLGYADIGLSSRLMLGVSYGGQGLISDHDVDWFPRIGFSARFRVVDELEFFPAVTVGYSDQGHGVWSSEWDRYEYKSRGFYGVASRNFYFYQWSAGWHAGVNYSLEHDGDNDDDLNIFVGVDVAFNYNLGLLLEWDAAWNDNDANTNMSGKGYGYLNGSLKWLFTSKLELEFLIKDMLGNRPDRPGNNTTVSREIRLTFIDSFGR